MKPTKITLVSGAINSGKTTKIKALIKKYKALDLTMAGFYSEKVFENDSLIGYDLVLLSSKKIIPFLRLKSFGFSDNIGPYFININAFDIVKDELSNTNVPVIFLDEIGRLELARNGFSTLLTYLLATFKGELILAVRDVFIDEVINHWHIESPTVIKI